MKYSVNTYAKALAEAAADPKTDDAKIMRNFLAIVRKNGDEAHLRAIVHAAERMLWEKTGVRKITVESARALLKPAHTLVKDILKPRDVVEEKIDPSLIAGVKIIVNEELQFDGSLKGRLDHMLSS